MRDGQTIFMRNGSAILILTLTLPDPDDRHVLAAAITGGATQIVSWPFNCGLLSSVCCLPAGVMVLSEVVAS